jgi:hypothetical protein
MHVAVNRHLYHDKKDNNTLRCACLLITCYDQRITCETWHTINLTESYMQSIQMRPMTILPSKLLHVIKHKSHAHERKETRT